ncbi:MAG: leucine-rich repeat domain-containing protein [Lachnospiraceae bacterium]|nr:leucine-rich repeat domain-containing protein [Lachnospiraceae bacterium]
MSSEISMQTPSGELTFRIEEGEATLTRYDGRDMELKIPQEADGIPVTRIGDKAFFNNRHLTSIILPEGITAIGNWAFSHCPVLTKVSLQEGECLLGKSMFDEDRKLRQIKLRSDRDKKDIRGIGSLLAATVLTLDAPYLLTTKIENVPEWLARWDSRMMSILGSDDMDGYTEVVLCGEEDYWNNDKSPEEFVQKKRWRKVRLCFLRLLYDKELAEADKEKLRAYLKDHTKGCETEETWLFLKKERSDDMDYLELFASVGCLTEDNFHACIADLPPDKPQMRAFLLKWQTEHLGQQDFFAALSLD